MSKFNIRLRELRTLRAMSQQELSDKIHISKSSINMYERGEREPGIDTLECIADFFNVDLDYLTGKSEVANKVLSNQYGIRPIKKIKLPVLGEIACGKPIYADEDRDTYIDVDDSFGADFCLTAKGDSMINARIYDGDIVFIKQMDIVDDGDIAAVIIDDEATLKRFYYYRDEGKLILQAENPRYKPLVYTGEELNSIKVLGKAVAFQSRL